MNNASDRLLAADTLFLGRATYETFAAAWPTRTDDVFGDRMNRIRKCVASSTLKDDRVVVLAFRSITGDAEVCNGV